MKSNSRLFALCSFHACLALLWSCSCTDTHSADGSTSDTPEETDTSLDGRNDIHGDAVQEPDVFDSPMDDVAADVPPEDGDAQEETLPVPRLEIRGDWLGVVGTDHAFRVCQPTGDLPPVPVDDNIFSHMGAHGRNIVYIQPGAGGVYSDSLYLYLNGNFMDGWNEAQWAELENDLIAATDNEVGVIVALWGTVALECDPAGTSRWFTNPWNADVGMGGPYDAITAEELCGKRAFYTFEDYGTAVYNPGDPYPDSASMVVKGQWRQEEIVHRVATLVRDYPVAAVMLMWEAGDFGTNGCGTCGADSSIVMSWHSHMADYIHDISPRTLVATGVNAYNASQFIPDSGVDFIEDEGYFDRMLDPWCGAAPTLPVPVVWTGYTREDDSGNECAGNGWTGCDRGEAIDNIYTLMRQGWLCGVQSSTPFWEYKRNFADDLNPYVEEIRDFLDTIVTWDDEPGNELNDADFPPVP